MRAFAALLLCATSFAFGQKMHVKVLEHSVAGRQFTQFIPGFGMSSGNASANCTAYGVAANCNSTANGNSISMPAHTEQVSLPLIQMLLLLPDGRRVSVSCEGHVIMLGPRMRACGNPEVDEFEADFSGAKVKLTWGVGLDGKKKESETYWVGKVYPAPPKE